MHADRADAFELTGAEGSAESAARGAARDPRMDPQPGDVLAVGNDVREVWDRIGASVEYGFPGKCTKRWLPLIRWQAWARLAEVKKVAP